MTRATTSNKSTKKTGRITKKAAIEMEARHKSRIRTIRACIGLILAASAILGWAACITHDPADPPAKMVYPLNEQVQNIAGAAGASFSYYAFHYFGIGTYMALLFASMAAAMIILGKPLRDLWLRSIGVVLAVAAVSTLGYLAWPSSTQGNVLGRGGVLGVSGGSFLFDRFGAFSWAICLTALLIGLLLSADEIMVKIPGLIASLWHKRKKVSEILATGTEAAPAAQAKAKTLAQPAKPAAAKVEKAPQPEPQPTEEPARRVSIMQQAELDSKSNPKQPASADKADGTDKSGGLFGGLFGSKTDKTEKAPTAPQPKPVSETKTPKPAPAPAAPRAKKPATANTAKDDIKDDNYDLPPRDMLIDAEEGYAASQQIQVELKRSVLQQTLNDFNVEAEVVGHMTGPVITMFELALAPGVKVSRIATLSGDIARALAARSVRIVSPIPGKDTIGIEVPNAQTETVRLKQLMNLAGSATDRYKLPLFLGKDASGQSIVADLASMPHMLIAGTTGSGKSVCINTIIMSLLMTRRRHDVQFIMVDPKMVEMAAFERIPHLLCPIVNDMRKAESILEWAATKMDERYELLKEAGVRNIAGYNALGEDKIYRRFRAETDEEKSAIPTHLPYYVIIVDELADLIMTSSKEVEEHIIRIAQKARAVGIHLILATQRPSANVVTGLIKSNMPCRISFQVASGQESRIVLDQKGAELLLGRGDMLFLKPGTSSLDRAQGTFMDDSEIHDVVDYISQRADQKFDNELVTIKPAGFEGGDGGGEKDDLFDKAVEIVLGAQRGSVSLLQRRLSIGYTRSSRIVDQMAEAGILGDYKGSQARECMMTLEDWHALQSSIAADQSGANSINGESTSY